VNSLHHVLLDVQQLDSNTLDNYTDTDIREARNRLWEMGCLVWKLSPTQLEIYNFFHGKPTDKTIVVNASRRLGKTFALIIMMMEQCIKFPGSIVKFLQPKVNMIRINIRPLFDEVLIDCPKNMEPEYSTQDAIYKFPNGSQIQLAGTDNKNYDKLRGGKTHLAVIDEAGFCTDLEHIITYILIPTTTNTRGRIILSSTTPPKPDHEFITYMKQAEIDGRLIRRTIKDAINNDKDSTHEHRITDEIVAGITSSLRGGEESDSFKTEYMCKVNKNSDDSVLPEFTEEVQKDTIVEWRKPVFCDKYESMDIGFADCTAILFAYYDFDNAVVVIEDEIVIKGKDVHSKNVAALIRVKEAELWMNKKTNEVEPPYLRIADNNLIFLNDLTVNCGINFMATDKHKKEQWLNKVRIMISERRIIINPRCKNTISHMENATWNAARTEFKQGGDREFTHHYDCVDALIYLCRNLIEGHNPYPLNYNFNKLGKRSEYFLNPNFNPTAITNPGLESLNALFKPRKKRA
jgi:hypothetical protein